MDEKINSIEFLHSKKKDSVSLLSTNDRIIKLWNIKMSKEVETSKASIKDD